jgi:hypothetical protein
LIKRGDRYSAVAVNYRGGLRYPHLEPVAGAKPLLDDLLTALP